LTIPDTSASAEILVALEEVYAQIKKVSRELRPTDRIVRDLDIDSLATLEILLALEERFGVRLIEDPRVARIDTVADLVGLLSDVRERP
jgi:acyl carrier protein